uniref:Uncharacterized protein n=1 Tax=Strongyloides stercoralis TaxID=6248 RepID=A0AAF5CY38_STRER
CGTFLLLIRITFEPQLIETFVVSSIVDLLWCSTGAGFGAHWRLNSFSNNADYDKGFIGCCSTGTDTGEWRLFWKKLEDNMETVVEGIGGCCSTGAESKTCKLFFRRNSFRINASYDSETSMEAVVEGIGGCCFTGAGSKTCKLFLGGIHLELMLVTIVKPELMLVTIKNPAIVTVVLEAVIQLELNLENKDFSGEKLRIMEAVAEGIEYCCSTEAVSKTCKLFFWRNSFSNNANYDKESRYSELKTVIQLELNLEHESCCGRSLEVVALLELNRKRVNFFLEGIHLELMLVTIVKPGCCSTGTDSEALRLFWKKLEDVSILQLSRKHRSSFSMEAVVEGIGGCCSTGALSKTCKLFFFGGIHSELMLVTIVTPEFRYYCCCFGGCCSTGTDSEALKLFCHGLELLLYRKCGSLELNLKRLNCFSFGRNLELMLATINSPEFSHCYRCFRGCCSTGIDSGEWRFFWKKLEDVPILQLNLKHRSFYVMELMLVTIVKPEFRHYYCCFGGCCSTGTDSEVLNLFYKKLEDVPILQLSRKHRSFSVMDYYSTGTESRAWKLLWKELEAVALLELYRKRVNFFFWRNSFRINASYDSETKHYCCCFGGCCLTGTDSEALRLFWKKLEDSMKAVVRRIGDCCSTEAVSKTCKFFSWRNSFSNNSNYDKESSHCYRCFGGCYSTGAESGEWRLFWKKLEDSMEAVVKGVGGCCSTGAESKTCKLFFGRNSFRINASYDSETRSCFSTGPFSGECKLFWSELETVIQLELNLEHRNCCECESLELNLKRVNFFLLGGIHLAIMLITIKNPEFRHYCCCFGGCCSTGTESEALGLFWKKLENSMEAVVEGIGGCCSTGAESKMCKLFFGRNLFRINASYDSETRRNLFGSNANYNRESRNYASYDKESSHCYRYFGGCYSTGAESGEWGFFWKKLRIMEAVVERIGGCCSTGAESKMRQLFSFGRNSFSNNANYDKESRYYCCCFEGCCLTGTDSEALKLFWRKLKDVLVLELETVIQLELSLDIVNYCEGIGSYCSTEVESGVYDNESSMEAVVEEIGGCCSTGAESKTRQLFSFERNSAIMLITIKNPEAVVQLELNLKHGSSSSMELLWKELKAVALLELNRECVNFSFGRNSFRINASYDSETRIYASYDNVFRQLFNWNGIWSMKAFLKRIGDCCFTGVKLGTSFLREIGGCCSIAVGLGLWMLLLSELKNVVLLELNLKCVNFFFGRNSFRINLGHDKEFKYVFLFRSTALQFRHYYCCSGGCCSTGANLKNECSSGVNWELLFNRNLIWSMGGILREIGSCCSTRAGSEKTQFYFTTSRLWRLFWGELDTVLQLEPNLGNGSSFGIEFKGCCSTGAESKHGGSSRAKKKLWFY